MAHYKGNRDSRSLLLLATLSPVATAFADGYEPLARTLTFQGTERTYYIALARNFRADQTYWPLAVVHGGGGNARTNPKAVAMRRFADEMDLAAIVILPEFITEGADLRLSLKKVVF